MRAPIVAAILLASLACVGGASDPPKIAPGTTPAPGHVADPDDPCDPCVLLLEHKLGDLRTGGWCKLCGQCKEPFPHAGVTCKELDQLRNCIYARLGYGFADAPEWREVFEKEPWYVADPDFEWDRVTPVQEYNARVLREMVSGRQCAR